MRASGGREGDESGRAAAAHSPSRSASDLLGPATAGSASRDRHRLVVSVPNLGFEDPSKGLWLNSNWTFRCLRRSEPNAAETIRGQELTPIPGRNRNQGLTARPARSTTSRFSG